MNDLAARYLMLSAGGIWGINILLIVVGAVAAALTWRTEFRLRRVTYILASAGLTLVLAIAQLYWIEAPQALAQGYVGWILGVSTASFLFFGYAQWVLGAARSRDINGSGSSAWLAFIPLANLYLIFARGEPMGERRGAFGRFVLDPVLVIVAFLVFGGANGLTRVLTESLSDQDRWAADPRTQAALATGVGPAAYIEQTVRELKPLLPTQVDDVTDWVDITSEGTEITFWYKVDTDLPTLSTDFGDRIATNFCGGEGMGPVLTAGGSISVDYQALDGRKLLHRTISMADCAA